MIIPTNGLSLKRLPSGHTEAQLRKLVEDSSPGKFEGESILTPYLYELAMNGDGEATEDSRITLFRLSYEEQVFFEEVLGRPGTLRERAVMLAEDDQGFCYSLFD